MLAMQELPLTAVQLDALREIGNVGAGNAATALGELLDKTVMIDIPRVRPLCLDETSPSDFFNEPAQISIAIYSKISGALKGGTLMLFSKKDSLLMSDALLQRNPGSKTDTLTPIDISALSESAYIFSCAYLSALGGLLNLPQLSPAIPQVAVDAIPNINKSLVKKFIGDELNYAVSIENNVIIEQLKIRLFAAFLLERESIKKTLEILGL